MTIFSHVAKLFLINALDAQIKSSIEKDVPRARLLSIFVPERDTELARTKREFLQGLKNKMCTLPDAESDLAFTKTLLFYFEGCKTAVGSAALGKNHRPGTTEALLEHLIEFIKSFHKKSKALLLTDQANDGDAFAHFSIVVASYHAKRIIDKKTQASLFQSVIENPALTPIIAFQKKLDDIVNKTYINARRNLVKQDKTDATHYMQVKSELGSLCIAFLELKLDKMLSEYSLNIYYSLLPHYLTQYLNDAQRATQGQISSISFTEDLDDYENDDEPALNLVPAARENVRLSDGELLSVDDGNEDEHARLDPCQTNSNKGSP